MKSNEETDRFIAAALINDVLWRRVDEVSVEHCRLLRLADAYVLDGRVLTMVDAQPFQVHYIIDCDLGWSTRTVQIATIHGITNQTLQLRRDASGSWWRDGTRMPEFDGLIDVDLSISPSTNTLPIRRLGLETGAAASTDAVWVRFSALSMERLPQRYTRTDERQYLYESRGGSFTADLEIDDHGMVLRYGDLWARVTG